MSLSCESGALGSELGDAHCFNRENKKCVCVFKKMKLSVQNSVPVLEA